MVTRRKSSGRSRSRTRQGERERKEREMGGGREMNVPVHITLVDNGVNVSTTTSRRRTTDRARLGAGVQRV